MTTTSIIIISILGSLVVILGFTTFNLLRKIEKTEDIIINYDNYRSHYSYEYRTMSCVKLEESSWNRLYV